MSNVSVQEIYDLTAAAFGVTVADIGRHYRGRHRRGMPLGMIARAVAIDICTRHTAATYPDIARAAGWKSRTAGSRFKKLADQLPDLAWSDFTIRLCVQAIEDRIDEIHEARLEAAEQAIARGFAGLAAPRGRAPGKPKTKTKGGSHVSKSLR